MALVAAFALVSVYLIAIFVRTRVSTSGGPIEDLDIHGLSARYRPMVRLLNGSDFQLLNDAGDPALARRMRSQRRAIFRGYLKSLRRDHRKICARIRELIVQSSCDQRELAKTLFKMQLNFRLMLIGVEMRLALHAAGFGQVAVWNLMECFEAILKQAETLSAGAVAS